MNLSLGMRALNSPPGATSCNSSVLVHLGDFANVTAHLNPATVFRTRQGLFKTDQRRIRQTHGSGLAHDGIGNDGREFSRGGNAIHLDQRAV